MGRFQETSQRSKAKCKSQRANQSHQPEAEPGVSTRERKKPNARTRVITQRHRWGRLQARSLKPEGSRNWTKDKAQLQV